MPIYIAVAQKPFLQPLRHPMESRVIMQARSVSLDTSPRQYVQF